MFEFRESLWALVAASLVLPFGVAGCSASTSNTNTLTGPLSFTVNGSGGGSGPVVVGGSNGGAGVGIKILLADVSLADVCVSGADITCAPSSQRVEIDINHLGAIPIGMPLTIATGVDVLRQSVVGGETCATTLGTAIAGSVTITASDAQHIAGNFSVTMQAPDNSTSMLTGTFDVNFCQALVPGGSTTGGTTGSTTTGGASSSGGTSGGTTTTGGATGATTSGGQTSGGTSGGTGTTGGTGMCAPGADWQGDFCTVASCVGAPDRASCIFGGTNRGQCYGGACLAPVDLTSDSSNCGFYGAVCPAGVTCQNSICRPDVRCGGSPAPTCPGTSVCVTNPNYSPSGFCLPPTCTGAADSQSCSINGGVGSCCSATCLDSLHDAANCGGCGVACGAGNFCNLGRCQPTPDCTTAPPGTRCGFVGANAQSCCGGVCIDVSGDVTNCGACGVNCTQTATCAAGQCSFVSCATGGCPAGLSCASSTKCVLSDCSSSNEGAACALFGPTVNSIGLCAQSACVDTRSNSANCGAYGRACGAGLQCLLGACQAPFDCAKNPNVFDPGGASGTNSICCGGTSVDTFTSDQNCLSCSHACPANSTCSQGSCHLVDGGPSACDANSNPCPAGSDCVTTTSGPTCVPSTCATTAQQGSCSLGGTAVGICCFGQCVDSSTDANNCRGCGLLCPSGSTCTAGQFPCTITGGGQAPCFAGSCAAGFACTNGLCAPNECAALNDRQTCAYGPGLSGTCCNNICVDLRQAGNCGACGANCPSNLCTPTCVTQPTSDCPATCPSGSVCVRGQCTSGLCTSSGSACATASGGVGFCCGDRACADLANDADSCGTCDVQCPAGQTCSNGICSLADTNCIARAGGYCALAAGGGGVCCGGGCIDVLHDAKNCGNCGVDCGTLGCFNGICGG